MDSFVLLAVPLPPVRTWGRWPSLGLQIAVGVGQRHRFGAEQRAGSKFSGDFLTNFIQKKEDRGERTKKEGRKNRNEGRSKAEEQQKDEDEEINKQTVKQ